MVAIPGIAIQNKIYESSNSIVYRGIREDGLSHCFADTAKVVVKLLKQDYPTPQEIIRYRQEYEITRSLNVAGVIKAYSQQNYQRTLTIFLEDFGGESLEYWMQQHPETFCPMPSSLFLPLAIDLTDILGRIHAARVIHKDINPSNIVFNRDTGVVKIIDFGIATRFNRTNPTFKSHSVLEGTPAYISPEQTGRMNRLLDYRTDFYSLGVTFYKLLTGQLPFATTDMLELVHCHLAKQPVPPHELNVMIPQSISEIILKLMAKNAEDRYQSTWGIKADLEQCDQQLEATGQIDSIQLGLQDVSDQFQISQKLYGRKAEISALLAAFDRVVATDCVANDLMNCHTECSSIANPLPIMLISGDAGVGKSALVRELYKPITQERGYFISGKFDQFQRNIPYSAIVDALKKLVQQILSEPDEQVQQWRSRLLAAMGNNGQLIVDVIPELELIVGKQSPVPEVGATEAQSRFNRSFQQFIRVFCLAEHPLVIFLDDLQWIDSATLKLVELLLLNEQTQFLFLIGAYRDHEVNPTHPLVLTLERLRKQGAVLQEITLSPLTLEPLSQMIAETLHLNIDTVRSLAQLVLHKTEGNPFFVSEFLKLLHSENLLSFDAEHLNWQWNVAQIEAQGITDNVLKLLLLKLKKLPERIQHVLRFAACIGAEFDLETLAIISEQSPQTVFLDLLAAVQAGLIQPISELDENLLVQEYKFLHDRVQQAAYALIPEEQRQVTHYSIGQLLLNKLSEVEQSELLFDIVNHINFGQSFLTQQDEKEKIARLNWAAAQKAIPSTAYEAAIRYLETGIALLGEAAWVNQYDLMLNLYRNLCAAQLSNASYEQLSATITIALKHISSPVDRADVYGFQVTQYTLQGKCEEAIQIGLTGLRNLGIEIESESLTELVREEFAAVAEKLEGRSISSLLDLPIASDLVIQATIKLLIILEAPAYITANIELHSFNALRAVRLSIEHGNIAESIQAYADYGFYLGVMKGQYQRGYEFANLAVQLSYKLNTKSQSCQAAFLLGAFIHVWAKPIAGAAAINNEGFLAGMESGEIQFAAYNLFGNIFNRLFQGKNLIDIAENIERYWLVAERFQDEVLRVALAGAKIFVTKLSLGQTQENDRAIVEAEAIICRGETSQTLLSVCVYYILRMHLSCLTANFEQGYHYFIEAGKISNAAAGFTTYSGYYYYGSLILLNLYSGFYQAEQSNAWEQIRANQERLKTWSDSCPENFLHKFHLVEAEKARVLGKVFEAEEFYEQAISGAAENEFIQEEALAYELAAKFYLKRGRSKIAQTYLKEASYCYERWGATAKVKDIKTRYPQFFPKSSDVAYTPLHTTSGTASHSDSAFDLAAVMKAAQAISSEIELEQLLRTLMKILIENAGSQTGFLILENSGEWVIEAVFEPNSGEAGWALQVLQSIPIADRLPLSIIQYVIRMHKSVILNDPTRKGDFVHKPYIQRHQPQSILCLPLLNQSKIVGVLYLENRLVTGAFTSDRLQVLHLLSAQAAISIENAKLYTKLRASESQLAQFLEAVPVGIGIVDAAGRPHYANRQAIQLLGKGIDPAATPNQFAELYQIYVAETDQTYPTEEMPIIRALNGEQTRNDDMEIHQSNAIIPLEVWGTPVYDEQGNVAYAIVAFQDISQRKQAEHLLASYNRTLEQQVAERTAALQASEAALRDQEQELRLITDALPVMISYVDANQCYQFVNHTYEVWFSCNRDEILGKSVREFLGKKAYQVVEPYINQVLTGQTVTLETVIPLSPGERYVSATLIPNVDGNAEVRGFYALISDISNYKRAETALKASESELQALFAAIPDPTFVVNAEGRIIKATEIDPSRLTRPLEEQLGKTQHELFGKEQADEFLACVHQVLSTQQMLTAEYSLWIRGQTHWFSAHIAPIRHDQVIWLARDITDRKRAEEASILEERNRLAREIHDTLAQSFTGILLQVTGANQVLTSDLEATQAHLAMIDELARTGLAEARRSVTALRPQLLEEGDLSSALNRLTLQMKPTTETALIYEIQGITYSLSTEVENNLLRIGQEALTNAIKHAGASEIRVELLYNNTQCILRIKDDGQGFRADSVSLSGGFGLLGMSERAERIGAQLRIRSQLGQGTEIVVVVSRARAS
jgi:PAS domain S-box-containing protein